MIKIRPTEQGIAFRIGNTIYLHKNLKDNPKLMKAILKHELAHTSGYSTHDIQLDMKGKYLENVKKDYYLFLLKNPKCFYQFLPVTKVDNRLIFDPVMFALFLLLGLNMLAILFLIIKGGVLW